MTKDTPRPNDKARTGHEPADGDVARVQDREVPPTPYADTSRLRTAWRMGINPNTTEADFERFQRQTSDATQDSATDSLAVASHRGFKPAPEPKAATEPQT